MADTNSLPVLLAGVPFCVVDGGSIHVDMTLDILAANGVPPGTLLVLAQDYLAARVDAAAEAARLSVITAGSGQAMEYQEAYAEAVRVDAILKANPSAVIDPAAFPMLAASIGCAADPQTGKPTADVAGEARSVLNANDEFLKFGAAIRAARLKGKSEIRAAATLDAAAVAFAAVAFPPPT